MRIPRIHHPEPLAEGARVVLTGSAANHVNRVLRLRPGAEVVLFDGRGGEYPAELTRVAKSGVEARLGPRQPGAPESPLTVTLVQGVSKGERMDYAVQKAVELGVNRVVPVFTGRSVVRLEGERLERRWRHWQGVAIGACEQSGRATVPEVAAPQPLERWLSEPEPGLRLVLHHEAAHSADALPAPEAGVVLLIGPEGGLSGEELAAAGRAGFQALRLGPRVMRTETAAVAALAVLQHRWGDLC